MSHKRWRNYYRLPDGPAASAGNVRICCTFCGHGEIMKPGHVFSNHCPSFATQAEAEEYAPRIYSFAAYMGARQGGASEGWSVPAELGEAPDK